jgi:HK97 family phage prohead protease
MSKYAEIAPRIWSGVATDDEMRAVGADDVAKIKSDAEHVRVRVCTKARPKTVDQEARTVEHVASDETADRMGDIIRFRGWDLGPFKKNPQLLWNHDSGAPPIGRVLTVAKDADAKALVTTSRFFDAEKSAFADLIWRMVADGDLPAVSVGFIPRKTVRPTDAEERTKLGLGEWGVVYEAAELLELSVVTVPANSNALMRRLDSMVAAGQVEKALAVQASREFTPSTRTVVPVAKPETVTLDVRVADPDGLLEALQEHRETLRSVIREALAETASTPGLVVSDSVGTPTTTDQLAEIKAALAALTEQADAIQHTLSAELPALRAQLDSVTRGSADPASQRLPMDPEVQPAPGSRALKPEAVFELALSGLDAAVAARKQKDNKR